MDWRNIIFVALCAVAIVVTVLGLGFVIGQLVGGKHSRSKSFILLIVIAICWMIVIFFGMARATYNNLKAQQQVGFEYEQQGEYYEAYQVYLNIYSRMGNWSDIQECIDRVYSPAMYSNATELMKAHNYLDALKIFLELGNYGNSKTCAENCMRAYLESR